MKLISHRGNQNGPQPDRENHPIYIFEALAQGFEVEIDVWIQNGGAVYLGHDRPTYSVNENMLKIQGLWCHAKNIEALYYMVKQDINCFWHQEDSVTLTSKGYIWTHSDYKIYTPNSIACHMNQATQEELDFYKQQNVYGICSDYVGEFR